MSKELNEEDSYIIEIEEIMNVLYNKIEELREFLLHSSLSIEDMERVDEILKS